MNWQTRTEHVILWSHTNDSGFYSHCRQHERQTRENASVFRSDWWMLEVRSFPVIWLVQPLPNWRFSRHRTRGGRPPKQTSCLRVSLFSCYLIGLKIDILKFYWLLAWLALEFFGLDCFPVIWLAERPLCQSPRCRGDTRGDKTFFFKNHLSNVHFSPVIISLSNLQGA